MGAVGATAIIALSSLRIYSNKTYWAFAWRWIFENAPLKSHPSFKEHRGTCKWHFLPLFSTLILSSSMGRIEFKPESETSQPSQVMGLMVLQAQLPGVSTATKASVSLVFRVKLILLWPQRTSQSGSHSSPWRNLLVAAHQQNVPLSYDSGFTPLGYSSFSMSSLKAPDIPELSHFLTQKPDISPQWSHVEWSLIVGLPWSSHAGLCFHHCCSRACVLSVSLPLSLSE